MVINKEEFITRMAKKGNTTKRACKQYLNLMLDTLLELLREGAVIKLRKIAKIEVTNVPEKETYNISTEERFVLPEHKCIKVRVSKKLQEKFNKEINK